MLKPMVCKFSDFSDSWYKAREKDLKIRDLYSWHSAAEFDFVNRKFWEWVCIAQALDERGMLVSGKTGLGFAVGTEPLAAYFAGKGCQILATDLALEMSSEGWVNTNQHAAAKEHLYRKELVGRDTFERAVSFQPMDMRTLEGLDGEYDFLWSSCALEHLGSLQAGLDYVVRSARRLKSGGVAVHTTEYNVSSNAQTIESGSDVVYRRQDIERLRRSLAQAGFIMAEPDFEVGDHRYDVDFDTVPYMTSGKPHLKLQIGDYVSTSMLIVVERREQSLFASIKRWLGGGASASRA